MPWDCNQMAARAAKELKDGMYVTRAATSKGE